MSIKSVIQTLALTATLLLMACGGSGGGGGSDPVTYSGLTSQAAVDDTNAKTLTEAVVGGSTTGTAFAVVSDTEEAKPNPVVLDLARIFADSAAQLDVDAPSSHLPGAIVTESGSDSCVDGGSVSYSLRIDDVTFAFTGSFDYRNCTEGDSSIDGEADVSGVIGSPDIELNLSFDSLTVTSGAESFTMSGTVETTATLTSATVAMDVRSRNNSTGFIEWLNNLTISISDNLSFVEMSVSGRYYHPDHGYVDIVTTTPFQIGASDEWPSVGQMVVTGASGSKARLTAISTTQYTVEVDADGDDVYDPPTTENWE